MKINIKTGVKRCSKCKIEKSSINFSRTNKTSDKLSCWCKNCYMAYYKSEAGQKVKERTYNTYHTPEGKLYKRGKGLELRYNINLGDYEVMFNEQNGVCKICGETETRRMLLVDHNHKTGKVRGLLCNGCNTGIGQFKEDIVKLQKAIDYLMI